MQRAFWCVFSLLAVLALTASLGYYALVAQKEQRRAAVLQDKHLTLSVLTGELVEGSVESGRKPAALEAVKEKPVVQETPPQVKKPSGKLTLAEKAADGIETVAPSSVAVPTPHASKPRIAMLIGGLGLSKSSTDHALTLPVAVSLGFSPYSLDLPAWMKKVGEHGNEVYLNVPMESDITVNDDPSSYSLVSSLKADKNLERLNWVLARAQGYKGVYTDADEIFSQSVANIRPVLKALKQINTVLVYGKGYDNASFLQAAKEASQPVVVSDLVVDSSISTADIQQQLAALEASAQKNGTALGMAAPYPLTVKLIEEWLPTLEGKGIMLVPVSELVGKR